MGAAILTKPKILEFNVPMHYESCMRVLVARIFGSVFSLIWSIKSRGITNKLNWLSYVDKEMLSLVVPRQEKCINLLFGYSSISRQVHGYLIFGKVHAVYTNTKPCTSPTLYIRLESSTRQESAQSSKFWFPTACRSAQSNVLLSWHFGQFVLLNKQNRQPL